MQHCQVVETHHLELSVTEHLPHDEHELSLWLEVNRPLPLGSHQIPDVGFRALAPSEEFVPVTENQCVLFPGLEHVVAVVRRLSKHVTHTASEVATEELGVSAEVVRRLTDPLYGERESLAVEIDLVL